MRYLALAGYLAFVLIVLVLTASAFFGRATAVPIGVTLFVIWALFMVPQRPFMEKGRAR